MKKLFLLLSAIILLSFSTDSVRSVYEVPRFAQSIASADLDLDGDLDIVTGHRVAWGYTNPSLSFVSNIDRGVFELRDTSISFCGYQYNVSTLQFNNDEYPDVLTIGADFTNGTSRFIRIFMNENGNFSNYLDFDIEGDAIYNYYSSGDIDGNGYCDILLLSNHDQFWGVMYNDGLGNLSDADYFDIPDFPPQQVACADLDGDGREDVVVSGQYTDIYYSVPGWFEKQRLDTTYVKTEVYTVDFDLDGDIDIVEFGTAAFTYGTFTENLGDRNFESHNDFYFQDNTWGNILADFNNDSLPDVIFQTMASQSLIISYNKGHFEMSEPSEIYSLAGYNSRVHFTSGDFDGNGYQDLAYAYWGSLIILFNDGRGNFLEDPLTAIHDPVENAATSNNHFICSPNPVANSAIFSFALPENRNVKICIYDLQGNLVSSIHPTENTKAFWNTLDYNNNHLKPGIYIARLFDNERAVEAIKIIIP